MEFSGILVFLFSVFPFLPTLMASSASLTTSLGDVRGTREVFGNGATDVEVFYGIPFAQPPMGNLRFQPPVSANPWLGVLDGTKRPKACWQSVDTAFDRFPGVEMWNPKTELSEDCLYLNVFKPVGSKSSKPKSIMVWIYGGGFWSGSSALDIYDAKQLSAVNDVIVVSIGYRVGALGFLYLGNSEAPGNAGLFDQVMALQWIKDNAINIGGSPEDITIFGESAGAVSVGFHLMSPLSRDLFSNAIMESSAPIADWAVHTPEVAKSRSYRLADSVSCDSNNATLMECLRTVDPQVLTDMQWNLVDKYFDMTLGPVVDGHFLPDYPQTMLAQGNIKITNVLMGVNKNEGIFFDLYAFQDDFHIQGDGQINKNQFDKILKNISPMPNAESKLESHYLSNTTLTYTDAVDAITGDVLFKCPVIDFAQVYSSLGGHVFMYSFEHRVSTNPWPQWTGVPHGYEIELVFGIPLAANSPHTQSEKQLSRHVMELWTRFATTGSPNSRDVQIWPEYTSGQEQYLTIDSHGLHVQEGLRRQQCAFLNSLSTTGAAPEIISEPLTRMFSTEVHIQPSLVLQ